jgi:hypothetical protein
VIDRAPYFTGGKDDPGQKPATNAGFCSYGKRVPVGISKRANHFEVEELDEKLRCQAFVHRLGTTKLLRVTGF